MGAATEAPCKGVRTPSRTGGVDTIGRVFGWSATNAPFDLQPDYKCWISTVMNKGIILRLWSLGVLMKRHWRFL